jgi:hypothetical protein
MKRFVKLFVLYRLTNEEHHKFISDLRGFILNANNAVKNALTEVLPDFLKLANEEDKIIEVLHNNNLTELLLKIDQLRDGLCRALQAIVNAYAISPFNEDQSIVDILKIVSGQFDDIYSMSPKDKTEKIYNLLHELESYEKICTHLHLTRLLQDLRKATVMYNDLCKDQASEWSNKNASIFMKDIRTKIDVAYSRIMNLLEVAILVGGTKKYSDFINTINNYIDVLRSTIRARKKAAEKQKFDNSGDFNDKSTALWD